MADFAELVLTADTTGLKQAPPTLDKLTAAAKKAQAEAAKLRAEIARQDAELKKMKASGDGASAGAKALGASLADLKAKLAATRAEAASTSAALLNVDKSNTIAAGSVGNLTAQFFDIGMMMQAGQNPLMLMVQQGSQVSQVLGPMGVGAAVKSLGSAFMGLLNPMNLVVMGVIGGAAALVQWATATEEVEEKVKTLADAQAAAAEAVTAYKDASEAARTSMTDLVKDYGRFADEVQRANVLLAENARLQAEAAITAEIDKALEGAYGFQEAIAASSDAMTGFITEGTDGFAYLHSGFQLFGDEADRVRGLLENLDNAVGLQNQAVAADELNTALIEIYGSFGAMPLRAQAVAAATAEITARAAEAGIEISRLAGLLDAATAAANAAAGAVSGIGSAAAGAYGKVAALVGKMREMATERTLATMPGRLAATGDDGRGGQRETVAGSRTIMPDQPWMDTGGGGGGGGGGSAQRATDAEKEAAAIQKVTDSLRAQIEAVGQSEAARRLHQELQKAGVSIYSEEGQQIAALVEQLTELEAKQKLVAETMRGIENAAQGFFVGVLSGAKDLETAIGDLLRQLGNLFLNQAFKMLWEGKPGGSGGLGGMIAGLFDAGGHIPAGQIGVVAEKRPELVDGKLVTRPTLVSGPADVTGGAATAKMMGVPMPQTASPRRASMQMAAAPRVTVTPPPVVVLDDPRKIDAWQRSPEGERTAAWQRRRMGNG